MDNTEKPEEITPAIEPQSTNEAVLPNDASGPEAEIENDEPERRKYPALEILQRLMRFFGWVWVAGCVIGLILAIFGNVAPGDVPQVNSTPRMSLVTIFGVGVVLSIQLLAAAEVIQVILDIQDNTYLAAYNAALIDEDIKSNLKNQSEGLSKNREL